MRQLIYRNGGARWPLMRKVLIVDFVIPGEVTYVDKVGRDLDQMLKTAACGRQNLAHVFDAGLRLGADVECGAAPVIGVAAGDRVVDFAPACSGKENERPSTTQQRTGVGRVQIMRRRGAMIVSRRVAACLLQHGFCGHCRHSRRNSEIAASSGASKNSISTVAPSGSAETPTDVRAGGGASSSKKLFHASLMSGKRLKSVV